MNIPLIFFGYASFLILASLATQAFLGAYQSEEKVYVIRIDEKSEAELELYLFMFFWFSMGYFSHYFAQLVKKNLKR